jgi:hypothetical protein
MSYTLILNSSNVFGANNNTYKYNFISGNLTLKNAEMAVGSIVIPYSWFNVSSWYANQTLSIVHPGTGVANTTISITLPSGFYSVIDINSYIQQQCIANAAYLIDSSGNYVYYLTLSYNATYYAVQLLCSVVPTTLPTGWSLPAAAGLNILSGGLPTTSRAPQLTLAASGSIAPIIGFAPGTSYPAAISSSSVSFISTTTPIGSTVNSLVCRCSLVKNEATMPSDILDSVPINVAFGTNINYEPSFERWVKIGDGTYNSFTLTFNDQNFNTLYANDPNVCITLMIRDRNDKHNNKH